MREIPILMSTPMVKANLDGRKSQTRRIVKIPDLIQYPERFVYVGDSTKIDIPRKAIPYDDRVYHTWTLTNNNSGSWVDCCPYGKPGDRLWVRETFYAYGMWIKNGVSKSGKQKWTFFDTTLTGFKYHYEDKPPEAVLPNTVRNQYGWFKRPSIFMPREACRILFEVTDGRVERLQDISEEDAIAEGVERQGEGWRCYRKIQKGPHKGEDHPWNAIPMRSPVFSYREIWENINGEGSWDKNPWVWVITYRKVQP